MHIKTVQILLIATLLLSQGCSTNKPNKNVSDTERKDTLSLTNDNVGDYNTELEADNFNIEGTYSYGSKSGKNAFGVLQVYSLNGNTSLFSLQLGLGSPSFNMGYEVGDMTSINSIGTYTMIDENYDIDCILNFEFFTKKVIVSTDKEHCNCGYGANVIADGTYWKTSQNKPKYYVNLESDTFNFIDYFENELSGGEEGEVEE